MLDQNKIVSFYCWLLEVHKATIGPLKPFESMILECVNPFFGIFIENFDFEYLFNYLSLSDEELDEETDCPLSFPERKALASVMVNHGRSCARCVDILTQTKKDLKEFADVVARWKSRPRIQ